MTTSNTETNKRLVADFVAKVWNAKNVGAVKHYIADGYIQHNPNLPNGRAALEAFMTGFFQNVPQGEFSLARIIADGDLVITHALFRAHADDKGMAVVDIYRIQNGKLVEHWDVKEAIPAESASGNPVV